MERLMERLLKMLNLNSIFLNPVLLTPFVKPLGDILATVIFTPRNAVLSWLGFEDLKMLMSVA